MLPHLSSICPNAALPSFPLRPNPADMPEATLVTRPQLQAFPYFVAQQARFCQKRVKPLFRGGRLHEPIAAFSVPIPGVPAGRSQERPLARSPCPGPLLSPAPAMIPARPAFSPRPLPPSSLSCRLMQGCSAEPVIRVRSSG